MLDLSSAELNFACEVVDAAGQRAEGVRRSVSSHTKGDRTPVTVADYAVQALVARRLQEQFPQDPLVAEEDSAALRDRPELLEEVRQVVGEGTPDQICAWIDRGEGETGARFWTLDPIDGTRGFLRGDQYAVCLALMLEGQVALSVMGCPNLKLACLEQRGVLVAAARGQGSWARPLGAEGPWTRLRVSSRETGLISLRSFESRHADGERIRRILEDLGVEAEPLLMDSQAKYAVLAAGEGELLFRLLSPKAPQYREKIWDQAAGALIVEEAGGKISDLDGKPLDFTEGRTLTENRGVLASNSHLHEEALKAIKAVGA